MILLHNSVKKKTKHQQKTKQGVFWSLVQHLLSKNMQVPEKTVIQN